MVRKGQAWAAGAAVLALLGLQVSTAWAQRDERGEREASPLDQAREESAVQRRPKSRFRLPGGELRVTAERLAAAQQPIRLAVELDRPVSGATLSFQLPALWLRRGPGGIPFAKAPASREQAGGRAHLRRRGRAVALELEGARPTDAPALEVQDVGIPAGTYEIPYQWRGADGALLASGVARVVLYAPTREARAPTPFGPLRGNATNNTTEESESFIVATPGNRNRVVVGINSNETDTFGAWVSGDAGQTWVNRVMPNTMDVPESGANEAVDMCCDPMLAADGLGNVWYGGLSTSPGRIVVNRIAAGTNVFRSVSTGLPARNPDTQDKPMMTIDNTPSSPRYGRLYVVWNEPGTGGGSNLVISQCDTRPGGVPNAANCDNSDNWTPPADVTPGEGSYIFGDVAVGPDSRVYVSWWDFSAVNAIRADVCDPRSQNCGSAAGWGSSNTVALLDDTDDQDPDSDPDPIPFACPIVAQPGGRASPAPQIDVSHAGATSGRVYVTWGDLRPGSGSTRCDEVAPTVGTPPLASHLTWDSFVDSAAGGSLPGGVSPSPSVGTRLLSDGEGGGQANSDDWFPWLAVDQTTGQAVADFYSTRDDASRQTTEFYVRRVTPADGGHSLGPLTRVSSAPSDYSDAFCCDFGNDYGDYEGLDATQGTAFPVWTDNSTAAGEERDGEAFTAAVPLTAQAAQSSPTSAPGPPPDTRRAVLRLRFPRGASRVLRRRALILYFRPDETVLASFTVRVSVPGASRVFRLRRVTRTFVANRRARLRFRFSRRLRRATSRALRRKRRVTARVSVAALDVGGNVSRASRRIRLRR